MANRARFFSGPFYKEGREELSFVQTVLSEGTPVKGTDREGHKHYERKLFKTDFFLEYF